MKRTIIRFKEPVSTRHYEIFYKDVPAILTKWHIKKLQKKKCWDIEIVDNEEIERMLDEQYYKNLDKTMTMIDNIHDMEYHYEGIENHIPRID